MVVYKEDTEEGVLYAGKKSFRIVARMLLEQSFHLTHT